MPDENGSRINNGMNPTGDIVNTLLIELKNTFVGAFQQQNKLLTDILTQQKASTSYTSGFTRFGNKSVKDILNQLEDLDENLERLLTHTNSEIYKLRNDAKKPVKSVDSLGLGKQISILERYQEKLLGIQSEITEKFSDEIEKIKKLSDQVQIKKEQLQKEKTSPSKGSEERVRALESSIESLTRNMMGIADVIQDAVSEQVEQITREKNRELDKQQRNLDKLIRSFDLAQQGNQELASISSSFGSFISKQQEQETKENANEEFMKAVKLQKETLTKYLKQINDKLKQDKSLTKEEKELLGKQKQLTIDQINYLRNLNPVSDIWKKAGQDMKQVGKDLASGLLNTTLGLLKNRFLESYEKGFQSVYSSLESTRNTISARMGLNQGAFEDLINDLQKDLTSQNLEGVMSVVDLQEALVSLSSAGITDKELLKELTMDMAELKASGSSLDLSNEETLSRIVNLVKQGTTTEQLRTFFRAASAEERGVRDAFGSDTALVHGGFNTILNQVLDIGSAYGRSMEQIADDLNSSITVAQAGVKAGLDNDYFVSRLANIAQKSPQELSKEELISYTQGVTPSTIMEEGFEETYKKLISSANIIAGNAASNPDIAASVLSAYGSAMTTSGALRYGKSEGITQTSIDESTIQEMAKSTTKALQEADWVSQTEKVMNKAENAMTDLAQIAERNYEGDKAFLEIGHKLVNTTGKILEILANAGVSTLKTALTGGGTAVAGAAGAAGMAGKLGGVIGKVAPFAVGSSGTVSGTIGKSLGVLGGLGITGYNLYQDIKAGEGLEGVLTDTGIWTGIGTTLGSAILGPLGGAAGGLLFKGASSLGNLLGDKLGDWFVSDDSLVFSNAVAQLQEAATKLYDSAKAEYNNITEQENTYKSFDSNQRKLYLLQTGQYDAEQLATMKEQDINDEFLKLVTQQYENEKKEAALELQKQAFIKQNADKLVGLHEDMGKIRKMSTETDESGSSEMERAITARLGKESVSSLVQMASMDGMSAEQIVGDMASDLGIQEKDKEVYVQYVEGIMNRKKKYEAANKEFQEKWKQAADKTSDKSSFGILASYIKEFGISPNVIIANDNVSPLLVNGLPNLEDSGGMYYENKFVGRYRSGLTRVPSNNYPAILHEGERVLTKRESDVYNEMSSYAMSQISSMASNSYSTAYNSKLDSESINRSINNQTSSVEQLLKQIIQMLQSISINVRGSGIDKGNSSILRMNSNITQLNTAT